MSFFWIRSYQATPDPLRRFPGTRRHKPVNEYGRLPEWSSSWGERLSESDYTKLWPSWMLRRGDRSKGINHLLLPWNVFRQTKQNRPASQPEFRSENTPATTKADQSLLALQQLANNSSFANFENIFCQVSKQPKSLTTTTTTFDRKPEKVELCVDLFQTSLKHHNQLTEDDILNYVHSFMGETRCRHSKTLTTQPERIWEKLWQFSVGST